jgi:hypothetical protein
MTKYPFLPLLNQLIKIFRILIPVVLVLVSLYCYTNGISNFWIYLILAILSYLTSYFVDGCTSIYMRYENKKYPIDKD